MNTEPISAELHAYLMEQQAANLPAVRQPAAPMPVSRMFPELSQPQTVIVQQPGPDPWVWRPLAAGASCTMVGLGIWFSGLGIHAIGSVSLWAIAAICISFSAARIFAPKRAAGGRGDTYVLLGSHNRINSR